MITNTINTIYWHTEDLRLSDNKALSHAASNGSVLPVYILPENLGAASYWWLHHSLKSLAEQYSTMNVPLLLFRGEPVEVLTNLVDHLKVENVVWNRVYSPQGIQTGQHLKTMLGRRDVNALSFNSQLLIEPTKVLNKQGKPFKVFTPFWRHCQSVIEHKEPLPVPKLAQIDQNQIDGVDHDSLAQWNLLPTNPDWSEGIKTRWVPGENAAQKRLDDFIECTVDNYKEGRDFPNQDNTSYLSPHFAFGEISPRQCWQAIHQDITAGVIDSTNGLKFLSEVGWREYSRYLLVHFPHIVDKPFNDRFTNFPWQDNHEFLSAWQQGQTGYPIVDAGMRELWQTGYMHNRVRMIVASFLCKHCLTHWHHGMAWFWDTLVDADIANNTASWQWVAGSGADASPYFRIFNPILQGEKFDGEGSYVKKWLPELTAVPKKFIHKPWELDAQSLSSLGVVLGDNYPKPIVEHKLARQSALEAYASIKQ